MGSLINIIQIVIFILIIISIPIIVFLFARKVTEWIVGIFTIFLLVFYYSSTVVDFVQSHGSNNGVISWLVNLLQTYRMAILDHWPSLTGFTIFNIKFLSMSADHVFVPFWLPIVILYTGGAIRLVILKFVTHDRLREITHEYWLYITTFLISLVVVSAVLDWNLFTTLIGFLLILLIVAAGLHRILIDIVILIIGIARHIGRWLWIGTKNIAGIAVDIAKIVYRLFKNIQEAYEHYIQEPILRVHETLNHALC